MLNRYTQKNKYGGHTWEITLNTLFVIHLHETNNQSVSIEFIERKVFRNKVLMAYMHPNLGNDFGKVIGDAFTKVYEYNLAHDLIHWSHQKMLSDLELVTNLYNNSAVK